MVLKHLPLSHVHLRLGALVEVVSVVLLAAATRALVKVTEDVRLVALAAVVITGHGTVAIAVIVVVLVLVLLLLLLYVLIRGRRVNPHVLPQLLEPPLLFLLLFILESLVLRVEPRKDVAQQTIPCFTEMLPYVLRGEALHRNVLHRVELVPVDLPHHHHERAEAERGVQQDHGEGEQHLQQDVHAREHQEQVAHVERHHRDD
mmetsp:Transcript_31100/g.67941  ORF Transcript_31100/g.67941 Transcript_31100/m.67941 type:complete len:203 (-) Transcript_31100:1080-1688(-)